MAIGDICNREVIIAYKQESLSDAIKLMRKYHVGDLVIVEDKRQGRSPVGILTDRDILISVIGENLDPDDIVIEDVMSCELLTAHTEDTLTDALASMRKKGVRRLPVVDDAYNLVGILTTDDIIGVFAEEIGNLAQLIHNEQENEASRTVYTEALAD
ncbi:MAG TPA: CBS domain-containing protein [Porticoccaceae bacterium]|nr:CBS domain-containing protein [Porticoccaceae bacterium]